MRLLVCTLLAATACGSNGEGSDWYVEPGGGGGVGGMGNGQLPDAATVDAGPTINGRICGLADLRDWEDDCAESNFNGYSVKLGNSEAITPDSGEFMLPEPLPGSTYWRVEKNTANANPINTLTQLTTTTDPVVLSMLNADYETLLFNAASVDAAGAGIFIKVIKGAAFLAGTSATVTPALTNTTPLYDGTSSVAWTTTATSTMGTIWLPNVTVGASSTAMVTITPPPPDVPKVVTIPVEPNTLTFWYVTIP